MQEQDVFPALGEDGFTRLVAAFYRHIPGDEILGPMYPAHDIAGAEQRLRDYLIYRFGGPARYIEERGHPRLRARHTPFPVDQAARDRWMQLMDRAFAETTLNPDAAALVRTFFENMATFMINRDPAAGG